MKTQNTLENKARFFAQYWGQKIICFPYNKNPIRYDNPNKLLAGTFERNAYLQLKPLSQISDEDCILIFNKFYPNAIRYADAEKIYDIKNAIKSNFSEDVIIDEDFIFYTDYLRSKGYALLWMDLSVEDLVEYGWVKLK